MATPTNPLLINQLPVAVAVDPADWFLIEQGGVYKKLAGSNISSGSLWTKNIDDTIFYNTNFVGIGTSTPSVPFDITSIPHFRQQTVILHPLLSDGDGIVISDPGGGVGRKPGIMFARNHGTDPRWSTFYDVDEDTINVGYLGTVDVRLKLLPDGGVVIPNMQTAPGITGTWWNDGGTVKIS